MNWKQAVKKKVIHLNMINHERNVHQFYQCWRKVTAGLSYLKTPHIKHDKIEKRRLNKRKPRLETKEHDYKYQKVNSHYDHTRIGDGLHG